MNLLGREHRIEFVLSSHARFLSGAHEGQWDGEVGLYYLRARYYDPSLGRFIQEDAVEGSADLPASQNRYVYCQNDPVSLIDPTGYSPENTGTPARYTLLNIGNYTAETSACYLPDVTIFSMNSSGINPIHEGDPMPIPEPPTSDINSPEACSSSGNRSSGGSLIRWEVRNEGGQIIAEDKGDGKGPIFYEIDEEGYLIDPVGNRIDKNDKDYESKRVTLSDISDIEKNLIRMDTLYNRINLTAKAWNAKGEETEAIIGFKTSDGRWRGFTIDSKGGKDGKGAVLGFEEGHHGTILKPIEKMFNDLGDTGIEIPSGSFLVAEVTLIQKNKDGSYNYDFVNPVVYRNMGEGNTFHVVIWPKIIEIRGIDARLFGNQTKKG